MTEQQIRINYLSKLGVELSESDKEYLPKKHTQSINQNFITLVLKLGKEHHSFKKNFFLRGILGSQQN